MKVLKFEAAWCNPCKIATNVLQDKGIEFIAVDVEQSEALAGTYKIMSIPTVVVLGDDGKETQRFIGLSEIQKMGELQ